MTRTMVLILALAAGGVAAQAGFAAAPVPDVLGISGDKPIAVNADSFSADLKAETGTYKGNVIVTQGDVRLHADEVTVAAPGGKAARMEAHGHVVVDSPSGQAIGDTGDYDVAAQVLHLNGHVVLTKDRNVMRGGQLVVLMASGEAHLTGSGEATPGQPQGRVQALFVPADKNANSGQVGTAQTPGQPAHP